MIWLAAGSLIVMVATLALFVVLVVVLFDRFDRERREWVVERRELNQRIQAPEIATTEAIGVESQGFVSPDDDAAFWEDYHARTVTGG